MEDETTQSDSLALAMYRIGFLPVTNNVEKNNFTGNATQIVALMVKYSVRVLLLGLKKYSPAFVYYVTDCYLTIIPQFLSSTTGMFRDASGNIRIYRFLGSVNGAHEFQQEILDNQVNQHASLFRKLDEHAKTSPKKVFKSLTSCVQHD